MPASKKRAIIFDFGNVIAFFDYSRVFTNFAKFSKDALTAESAREKLFNGNLLEKFEVGKLSELDFIKAVRQRLNLEHLSEKQIIDIWTDLFTPNEEMIEAIQHIPADIVLILGSTTNPIHFEYYRQEFSEVLSRFKAFVTSFKVGALKPSPIFYKRCLAESGCQPSECLYIDDIPEYVEAAAKLGIEGIIYNKNADIDTQLRTYNLI
jgi:HAD superfamily hydrolase (TIGR01509 family)